MPVPYTRKKYREESFYHIYFRGRSKQIVFRCDEDKVVFLSLLKRYLSKKTSKDRNGVPYKNFYGRIELNAFCLMDNHIHLLIFQVDKDAIKQLMQRVICCYVVYFNKKYSESGPLFESRYKAKPIDSDTYYAHIAGYIDMNPKNWLSYMFSSLSYLLDGFKPDWFKPDRARQHFDNLAGYLTYLYNYDIKKHEFPNYKTVFD